MAEYTVEGALPPEVATGLAAGTNLLVSGPPMTGKRELALELLACDDGGREGSVLVTSREPASALLESYRSVGGDARRISVIDCVGGRGDVPDAAVRHVPSPGDLTSIGIEFSKVARSVDEAGVDRIRVGVDSLSPMLMYVDLQRLFRFLHVFTSQIQAQDWLGLFVIDPTSHEDRAVNTLQQLFDGVLELREADGSGRDVRLRGAGGTGEWATLE